MCLFQATLQHGPGNPVAIEDDEEIVEDSEDGRDFHQDDVVFLDIRRVSPGRGLLVEIEDDPRDAARAVERAEEREELQARHLTMDDQVWREAMETEQLSWVDPVLGYIPPPAFDAAHYPDLSSSSN